MSSSATWMIEVSLLHKTARDATSELLVLSDVASRVERGETLAIVGASGSGRSALLGLLTGLDLPTSNSVKLLGNGLFKLDEDGCTAVHSSHVGFVFQSFQLLPHLTALENVMLPLELQSDVSTADMHRHATVLLERIGLGVWLSRYPKTLPDSERQRMALARTSVTEPDILFAGEPADSLDTATDETVITLIFELNRSTDSTLVLVTHDHSMTTRCNRILTIEAGHLVDGEIITEL